MFRGNKEYHQSLIDQHEELSIRKMNLQKQQREVATAGGQIDMRKDQIREVRDERDKLQREFETIM